MTKKITKITIVVVLSIVILFELGYIVKRNILNEPTSEKITEATPEPIPVVGEDKEEDHAEEEEDKEEEEESRVIVIDAGHGKPSSLMSDEEKRNSGWIQNESGNWGEWRHYKSGSATENCEGVGCNGRVPPNGSCWYPIGNGDRSRESDINLKNAVAAKRHLEGLGYTVRMTRTSANENPSITKRLSYCFPDNDMTKQPDARLFICIHSNAADGAGRGIAYVSAKDPYDQAWTTATYASKSNDIGSLCTKWIDELSSLSIYGTGEITWEPELIALCKSPVPCGYLEIGFFDNSLDLDILNSENDKIGEGIAKGVDEFCKTH